MTNVIDIQLPVVSFDSLESKIRASKSEGSVRSYLAVVNRLRSFTGLNDIALSDITPDFVDRFESYLLDSGVTQSSANHFKMILRAMFKDEFGKDHRPEFRSAFRNVSSVNSVGSRRLTAEDVRRLRNLSLTDKNYLEKIRAVFLFCVCGGGMSYNDLKTVDFASESLTRHQWAVVEKFRKKYDCDFAKFVAALSEENYSKGLAAIGEIAGLRLHIGSASAADAWTALAAETDINPCLIECASAYSESDRLIPALDEEDITGIRETVSDRIWNLAPKWYAMRCYGVKPDEMIDRISKSDILDKHDVFDTFVAPRPEGKRIAGSTTSVIETLLFFRCSPPTAVAVRNAVKDTAWVYTLAGTAVPAQISAVEMRIFMILCDVGGGSVSYHFPQSDERMPEIRIGQQAQITDGDFTGYVGIVSALPDNKYKVAVTFTTLCATITAEIPVEFIKF